MPLVLVAARRRAREPVRDPVPARSRPPVRPQRVLGEGVEISRQGARRTSRPFGRAIAPGKAYGYTNLIISKILSEEIRQRPEVPPSKSGWYTIADCTGGRWDFRQHKRWKPQTGAGLIQAVDQINGCGIKAATAVSYDRGWSPG